VGSDKYSPVTPKKIIVLKTKNPRVTLRSSAIIIPSAPVYLKNFFRVIYGHYNSPLSDAGIPE